jgi:hypothetical protein
MRTAAGEVGADGSFSCGGSDGSFSCGRGMSVGTVGR